MGVQVAAALGHEGALAPTISTPRASATVLDWVRALVVAIACELPSQRGLHLSRHFASSVWRVVRQEGVAISLRAVQRILANDHLKPWR
jgi:hypothetical protein